MVSMLRYVTSERIRWLCGELIRHDLYACSLQHHEEAEELSAENDGFRRHQYVVVAVCFQLWTEATAIEL